MITFGLALPHYDGLFPDRNTAGADRTKAALAYAHRAEALGFAQVWVSDHLWIDLGGEDRCRSPDCWTLLAAIAATTERIRLGSLVTPVTLRPPALLIHQIATVAHLAGNRLDLGLGAGWQESEFTEHRLPFPAASERLAAVERTAAQVRRTFGPDAPAIWIGGKRAGALAAAARSGDGWNLSWDPDPGDFLQCLERVRRDRGSSLPTVSVGLTTMIGEDEADLERRWHRLCQWAPGEHLRRLGYHRWRSRGLIGTPEEIRERVSNWHGLGVDQIVCAFGMPFGLHDDEQMALFAATVGLAA